MQNKTKQRILLLLVLSLFIGVWSISNSFMVLAQGATEITDSLSGGGSKSYPVQLNQGEILQVTIKSMGTNIAVYINDPNGNQVESSRTATNGMMSYQARINGQHTIVVSNINDMDGVKRVYDLSYEILPASNVSPLNLRSNSSSGSLGGGSSYSIPVQLNQGEILQITIVMIQTWTNIYIKDPTGNQLQKFSTTGIFSYQATVTGGYIIMISNTSQLVSRTYDLAYTVQPAVAPLSTSSMIAASSNPAATISSSLASNSAVSNSSAGLIATVLVIAIIIFFVFIFFITSRIRSRRRYYYDEPLDGPSPPQPRNPTSNRGPEINMGRARDLHVPKVNRKGADFITGANSLRKSQEDALKKTKKRFWG